jgi:hypothetical protein
MPKRLLSSLTWKAGVAAAAVALVAGTGATTIAFVNASDDKPAVTTPNEHANDTAGDHVGDKTDDSTDPGDATKADDDTKTTADANDSTEHDSFGAAVSEDAKDGGVDGRAIRDLAPGAAHRSDKATEAHDANADNGGDEANDDVKDEHATDGQEKADDANGEHGAPEATTDGTDD